MKYYKTVSLARVVLTGTDNDHNTTDTPLSPLLSSNKIFCSVRPSGSYYYFNVSKYKITFYDFFLSEKVVSS